ncbi:DNA repair protein RadC [Burkholderia pyrrocinia]|uniref:JAB domain-containing protein n=1 Tax=Burkholderia pyrrocinia TaxID=60550 RepID=UPI001FB2A1BD|nr:JAB domain-containing protein [Burkholderia pyrrocinia]UOB57001.1 DNA repair protein RadC [Burkholderia pyrrocinia]
MDQTYADLPAIPIASRFTVKEQNLIQRAIKVLESRLFQRDAVLNGVDDVRQYVRLKLGTNVNEAFAILCLDNAHRVICFETLFKGTIDQAAVYPRVILQRALANNAAAVILVHNHPSGRTDPSAADRTITAQITSALSSIGIPVLDHFIVGQGEPYSFAQAGLL